MGNTETSVQWGEECHKKQLPEKLRLFTVGNVEEGVN